MFSKRYRAAPAAESAGCKPASSPMPPRKWAMYKSLLASNHLPRVHNWGVKFTSKGDKLTKLSSRAARKSSPPTVLAHRGPLPFWPWSGPPSRELTRTSTVHGSTNGSQQPAREWR